MKKIYHSALKKELPIEKELDSFEHNGSKVFYHDITHKPFPMDILYDIKAIYSEPAWKDGYDTFLKRSGTNTPSIFQNYLNGISNLIKSIHVPVYLIIGKHMLPHLLPDKTCPIKLHGYQSLLGVWNTTPPENMTTNEDIIEHISNTYDKIFDFSCGYGNIAQAMLNKNKKFLCSDINKKCVYYIATKIMGKHEQNLE